MTSDLLNTSGTADRVDAEVVWWRDSDVLSQPLHEPPHSRPPRCWLDRIKMGNTTY